MAELEEKERKHFEEKQQQSHTNGSSASSSSQAQIEDDKSSRHHQQRQLTNEAEGELKPEEYEQLHKYDDTDADFGEESEEEEKSKYVDTFSLCVSLPSVIF